jgi:hypothetical protein
MGMLRVLSRNGDDRYVWNESAVHTGDPEAIAAIAEAERIFREERAKGSTALRVAPGRPAERIDEFDPEAEQIMMVPRVIGG